MPGMKFPRLAKRRERDSPLQALHRDLAGNFVGRDLLASLDPLFTPAGWAEYVRDLLVRMINPYLRDRVDRVVRDPRRKLGWDNRLIRTMRLALEHGVEPWRYALGAAAAVELLLTEQPGQTVSSVLESTWGKVADSQAGRGTIVDWIERAREEL